MLITVVLLLPARATAQTEAIPEPPPFPKAAGLGSTSVTPPVDLSETDAHEGLRAITPRGASSSANDSTNSVLPSPGSVLAALAFVIILIVVASRLWNAHGPKLPGSLPREAIEVLGRCRIESRQSLYLVRLGSRILVIGSAGGELKTLSEITDQTEVDLLCGQCRALTGQSPFSRLFEARRTNEAREARDENAAAESRPNRAVWNPAEQRLAERFRSQPTSKEAGHAA